MPFDAFTRDLGVAQGRIAPHGWTPPEGDYVVCLGADVTGRFEELDIGDSIQVSQTATFDAGTKFLRARVKLRGPTAIPNGAAWRFTLWVNGVECARRTIHAGQTRDLIDLAANVSKLVGAVAVALRLELVAP